MNYLQLCQRFRQETGYASSGPSAVTSQSGYHKRVVDWINSAYTEIQNQQNWDWLRKEFTLSTTASDESYAYGDCTDVPTSSAITRFRQWAIQDTRNPVQCYLSSSGVGSEYWLTYIDWADFRRIYQIGTEETGAPAHITIDPNQNLVLGPTPDDTYVITGEYWRSAQTLSADSDTPEMPAEYHMLIVFQAMEDYAYFEDAQDVLARVAVKRNRLLNQVSRANAPAWRKAGPLI